MRVGHISHTFRSKQSLIFETFQDVAFAYTDTAHIPFNTTSSVTRTSVERGSIFTLQISSIHRQFNLHCGPETFHSFITSLHEQTYPAHRHSHSTFQKTLLTRPMIRPDLGEVGLGHLAN